MKKGTTAHAPALISPSLERRKPARSGLSVRGANPSISLCRQRTGANSSVIPPVPLDPGLAPPADRAGRLSITWRAADSKLATRGATKRATWAKARACRGSRRARRSAPAAVSLVDAMRRAGSRWLDASGANSCGYVGERLRFAQNLTRQLKNLRRP